MAAKKTQGDENMEELVQNNTWWEWVFSGIGVAILSVFVGWLLRRKKEAPSPTQNKGVVQRSTNGDNINIKANHSAFAKDDESVIQINDSQVGVLGNNASIKGGIHIKQEK
ncbi:hypothetical protein [Desulfosarcina ovata]|uniref:Uncharacterized protein n=1 Tax=Desulfosarcina ovata subsp. ovata TaxID=2752305 RepID=A0A5K8AF04_9BACT|nr:hypothetical protein [Desulfosarcina ovata]BBO91151.1 hypothetical protein DSCOOX_43310 [Desulfosarcina ovata subsp. ovata]